MRPDLIIEYVSGLHVFTGETDQGREWLEGRPATGKDQWLGKSLAVENESKRRDLVDAAIAAGLDIME